MVGVVAVREGIVVKSYGYRAWRPCGHLVSALRNLDRWAADEIVVLDISRRPAPDAEVLDQIRRARISTPLAYGGGIRGTADLSRLMDAGCDRFVIETLLLEDPRAAERLAEVAGRQALIGSLPVVLDGEGRTRVWRPGSDALPRLDGLAPVLQESVVSEFLVTDVAAEGRAGSFDPGWPERLPWLPAGSAIWFGGLDAAAAARCLGHSSTAAVAFGNPLHETELALPALRRAVLAASVGTVRPARLFRS